mmetsp:Transcript_32780/g.82626  ORF Transcript_32780/g.82626 Transcript_32780/m.82626 type:complete len:211 (+) Transcript_32780:1225-1857(+)
MPCSSNSDADDLRSMLAVSCCPDSSASSSAVADPPRSDDSDAECLRLAPASIRSCRQPVDPLAAAAWSGEYPPRILDLSPVTAAPACINALHMALCPAWDATMRGVAPSLFRGSTSAPRSSNATSASSSSARAASWSAVSPPSSLRSISAPLTFARSRHDAACPQLAAVMRGVWPSESASLTSAPIEMSAVMARSSPSSAAWCRGVALSY